MEDRSTVVASKSPEEKALLAKANNVQNSEPSEYVIGRMEHICQQSLSKKASESRRFKKNKNNEKFMSVIVEGDKDEKI